MASRHKWNVWEFVNKCVNSIPIGCVRPLFLFLGCLPTEIPLDIDPHTLDRDPLYRDPVGQRHPWKEHGTRDRYPSRRNKGPDRQPGRKWHHTETPLPHGQNDWHTLTCINCSIPKLRWPSGRCVVLLNAGSKKSTILRPAVMDKTRIQRYDVRPLADSVHVHRQCTFYLILSSC